jgi:hypothetical protein
MNLNLFHEQAIQAWFLDYTWFIQFWNTYYGTAHFVVTLAVFVLLFTRRADVFPQWRNSLAAMTALAIIGFAWFPLMPPRLLDEPCPRPGRDRRGADVRVSYGGACIESDLRPEGGWGFVDTLAEFGGPWSFDSEAMASISNQYAAMPSLHIGWSTWCAIAIWPLLRRRSGQGARAAVSRSDAVLHRRDRQPLLARRRGGLIVFGAGALIGWGMHRWNQDRLDRRHAALWPPRERSPTNPRNRSLLSGSVTVSRITCRCSVSLTTQ